MRARPLAPPVPLLEVHLHALPRLPQPLAPTDKVRADALERVGRERARAVAAAVLVLHEGVVHVAQHGDDVRRSAGGRETRRQRGAEEGGRREGGGREEGGRRERGREGEREGEREGGREAGR